MRKEVRAIGQLTGLPEAGTLAGIKAWHARRNYSSGQERGRLARELGWERPSFFGMPEVARATMIIMDGWNLIPFMMIMILAGLQAIPKEIQ